MGFRVLNILLLLWLAQVSAVHAESLVEIQGSKIFQCRTEPGEYGQIVKIKGGVSSVASHKKLIKRLRLKIRRFKLHTSTDQALKSKILKLRQQLRSIRKCVSQLSTDSPGGENPGEGGSGPDANPSSTPSPIPSTTPSPQASPQPSPAPSQSPAPQATPQMLHSITDGDFTYEFEGTVSAGQYLSGDWWVVGPVTITAITPDFNGSRHGFMLNPGFPSNGSGISESCYDSRHHFNAALCQTLPLTISPGSSPISLVKVKSYTDCADNCQHADLRGDINPSYIQSASILTIVNTVPTIDAYRPNYIGSTKLETAKSELDLSIFNRNLNSSRYMLPDLNMLRAMISEPWFISDPGWSSRYSYNLKAMPGYGREQALGIAQLALYALHEENLPEREHIIHFLIQFGIDVAGIVVLDSDAFRGNGGQTNGKKLPLALLARAYKPGPVKDFLRTLIASTHFSEDDQVRTGTPFYAPNAGTFWDFGAGGENEKRHPSTWSDAELYQWRYKACCTMGVFGGTWLVIGLLDLWPEWQNDAFRAGVYGFFETEDLISQANIINPYHEAVYGGGLGDWWIDLASGHGRHWDNGFIGEIWRLEANQIATSSNE